MDTAENIKAIVEWLANVSKAMHKDYTQVAEAVVTGAVLLGIVQGDIPEDDFKAVTDAYNEYYERCVNE